MQPKSAFSGLESAIGNPKFYMYISTLRTYVKAMGRNLEIVAQFPEGNVKIAQFEDLDKDTTPAKA